MNEKLVLGSISFCIEKLRKVYGWNLSQIADQIGMNYEPFRNLVRGHVKRPPFDVILRLHQLADRSLDESFGLSTGNARETAAYQQRVSHLEARIQDLELEKHLLLDWIRQYAMSNKEPEGSTLISFVQSDEPVPGEEESQNVVNAARIPHTP